MEIAHQAVIRPIGRPGDFGWVVLAHGEMYAAEYGWSSAFEVMVAGIVADFAAEHDPAREAGWIAELDGRRVGSVFCVDAKDEDIATAKLRVLLVDPAARGHHLGTRLVEICVEFARAAGYRRIRLWTMNTLAAARHVYLTAGFRLVAEEPGPFDFGDGLTAQVYELEL
ncbi:MULTISPECIES: GNAT family N-acetyltransferase [Kitasatospora]|uniref:GNAT family N-acetyltransferase n=1 Tax=Kitasatospora TaxID=2063 RepID=UPI0031DBBAA3